MVCVLFNNALFFISFVHLPCVASPVFFFPLGRSFFSEEFLRGWGKYFFRFISSGDEEYFFFAGKFSFLGLGIFILLKKILHFISLRHFLRCGVFRARFFELRGQILMDWIPLLLLWRVPL